MKEFEDLTGKIFGKLTVIQRAEDAYDKTGRAYRRWTCECSCENHTIKDIREEHLLLGNTKSCGCLSAETCGNNFRTHGKSETRLYRIWENMKKRCNCVTNSAYPRYGGRGIHVCDEWNNDFVAFETWAMANGYSDKLSIDRIDNNSDYCPENCRWATDKEQSNNRRTTKYLTCRGETHNVAEWSEMTGVPMYEIRFRLYHGWSVEDAIFTPLKKIKRVIRTDLEGNETLYESVRVAAEELGVSRSAISRACNETWRKCQGYYWRYEDNEQERMVS